MIILFKFRIRKMKMLKINIGRYDLLLRVIAGFSGVVYGLILALSYLNGYGLLLAAVSVIVLSTALIRWCPIYAFFNLNTLELLKKQGIRSSCER